MRGHAYDVCVKLRDHRKNKLQFKESCRVITISEEQSEDSVNQRNMVRQPAVACEDSDSAWLAYNTPSRDNGARRVEYRLLEIDNDLRRVQIDVRTLATNIDCVAMAIKNMKEQLKEILDKLNTYEKTRVETCQTITCGVDSNTKEDERAEDSFQIKLKSGKVLPERQGQPQNGKDKEIQINEEAPTSSNQGKLSKIEYNILSHLRKVPALLSVYDALMMSRELRDVLIYALQNPEPFYAYFAEMNMKEALYSRHIANVTFTDEDMLLGTAHHNRPLYVTGTSDGEKINRILIDPGSSVNILTLRTLKSLALNVDHLSSEKILIQGFNQHSQKALGSIILPIKFGALRTDVKFYVINADTSYKALLGRPWLHEYNVVPSTLHQCMKYIKDGEEFRIDGDIRPFGVHEVRYEDARYFAESEKDIKLSRELEEGKVQSDKKLSKGKIKIEDNKENVIPHFGSDSEDSDDEEQVRKMLETFSFKLNMPWGEDSSEDEEIFLTSESNMFVRTPELIEDSLTITRVPYGHIKSLHINEPTKVNDLKTFFVPPQVEKVKGKERIKKGILFYKSDDYKPSDLIKLDNSDEEIYEDVNMPKYFPKNLKNMMNRSGIPARRSRANRKFFQKMWNPQQKRVVLPNGRTIHTRGLGYHQSAHMHKITNNDSLVMRHTCTMITIKDIKQDKDMISIEPVKTKLLELKDAPQELEDGGQATVDELLEINLGNEEDRRPDELLEINLGNEEDRRTTYISALLPEKDQDMLKILLLEYKDCFALTYKEMPDIDPSVAVHKLAISPDVVPVKQAPRTDHNRN
ncbi:uncharacterized protein LOC109704671 [Ananas comosus]|uniref:Uncharacterized protein LOC109704671 n=1 Tax=Ananas comosus TaxID=4615 RepID=A0A6P5EHK5_ANACO|nr:uncharacterized protein LOC109704671 [Ananas comosus]